MASCNGRGADGDHCCWIGGKVCQFLVYEGDTPRCSVWGEWGTDRWRDSPAGRFMADRYPGSTCADWPQNIPGLLAQRNELGPFALCCWSN